LPYTTPIIMLVLSVKRALSSPVILALAASVIIAMPAAYLLNPTE
jgi:putative flippase GtrA